MQCTIPYLFHRGGMWPWGTERVYGTGEMDLTGENQEPLRLAARSLRVSVIFINFLLSNFLRSRLPLGPASFGGIQYPRKCEQNHCYWLCKKMWQLRTNRDACNCGKRETWWTSQVMVERLKSVTGGILFFPCKTAKLTGPSYSLAI